MTDLGESYVNRKLKTGRNITRGSFFEKLNTVAMVMKKPPNSRDVGPTVLIFATNSWLINTNFLAKNQKIPLRDFEIGP